MGLTRLKGSRYSLDYFLADLNGGALKPVHDNVEATYLKDTSLLDPNIKELLIIIACVAKGDMETHIQIHMCAAAVHCR